MVKASWVGIWLVLMALLTPPSFADPFWKPKALVALLGYFVFALLGNVNNKKVPVALNWLGIYLSALFIYKIIGPFALMRVGDTQVAWEVWTLFSSLSLIGAVFAARAFISEFIEHDWVWVAWQICIVTMVVGAYALVQRLGFTQWLIGSEVAGAPSMFSTLGNQGLVGCLCAIGFPFLYSFKKVRPISALAALVVVLTLNKAGILAILCSLMVLGFMNRKRWLFILASVTTGSALLYGLRNWSDNSRFDMWNLAMEKFAGANVALTGFGPGSIERDFARMTELVQGTRFISAHNLGIDALYELGIIGVGLILWLAYSTAEALIKAPRSPILSMYSAGLISVLVVSMFWFPFHIAPLSAISLLILCGVISLAKGNINVKYSA